MSNKFATSISKEELNKKPLIQFQGKIHVIDHPSQIKNSIEDLKNHTVLGFDTETKPTFKKGQKNKVAILQLSTSNDAYLFRLQKHYSSEIYSILEDESILKIGAAIRDDLAGLQTHQKFKPSGFIELQEYVNKFNIEDNGLKKLSAIVMGSRISKSQQTSNWENEILTEAQQIYAATDAWICLEIFKKLNNI